MGEFLVPSQESSNGTDPFPVFTVRIGTGGPVDRDLVGHFETWVCAACGFTEWYAGAMEALSLQRANGRVRYFDAGPAGVTSGG
jgi:hypothetical protein